MCCYIRLCIRFTGLLLLTELLLLSAHAQTATPLPKIQEANEQHLISRTVHGADVEIPLTFVSGAQASGPFTVTVGPIARSDGFVGKDAKLSSTQSGKELVVGSNSYLSLRLEAELPEFTTYHSWIMLSSASESIVYDLKLQRRSIQLAFSGAKNNLLELSTSSRKIDVPITFELAEGQTEVKGLKLSISSFARMDGRAIDREKLTIVQPEPLDCKISEHQTVHLVGSDILPGKYWAGLSIRDDQSAQFLDIQLTCAEPTQRIAILPITDTAAELWAWSATASATLSVDEVAGQLAEVYTPHLESLEALEWLKPTDRPVSLSNSTVEIVPVQGPSSETSSPHTTLIKERDSKQWTIRVNNLNAGKYKAKLSVAGPDLAKTQTEFIISVRHAGVFAIIPIFLGVVGSLWIHWYLQTGRSKRLCLANLARTDELIRSEHAHSPDAIFLRLLEELSALRRDSSLRIGIKIDDELAEFNKILKDVEDRRVFTLALLPKEDELASVLMAYPAKYDQQKNGLSVEAERMISAIRGLLSEKLKESPDDRAAVAAALSSLSVLIDTAKSKRFTLPIDELLDDAAAFKGLADKDLSRPKSLWDRLAKLTVQLNELKDSAKAGVLTGLEHRLNEATNEYYRLRVDDLAFQLAALEEVRIITLTPALWQAFDAASSKARRSLADAKNLDLANAEKSVQLHTATIDLQLAQIEYLQVVVDNAVPPDFDIVEWRLLIDKHVTPALKKARQAADPTDEAAMLQELLVAQSGYEAAIRESMDQRISNLIDLVREKPTTIEPAAWERHLLTDDTASAISAAGAVVRETTPNLLLLERKFVAQRINLLRHTIEACQNAGGVNEITKTQLAHIETLLTSARAHLATLTDSALLLPPPALQLANNDVIEAQKLYKSFVAFDMGGARNLALEIVEAIPRASTPQAVGPLLPSTQVIASSSIHFSATPPLPPPPPGPPESESELLRLIERDDTYVQLISVLLAIAGGFSFLYLPDETWGSCYDYIYAFLWGFGLNEAGKGILTSLANQGLWRKVPT